MTEDEKWVNNKINNFKTTPLLTLEEMLSDTILVIEQHLDCNSVTSLDILKSCLKNNKIFIEEVNKQNLI
jgi:hypothetical protein